MARTLSTRPQSGVELGSALLRERQSEFGADLVRHLFAGRTEDRQFLLGQVLVDPTGEFFDRVIESLGVGAAELEDSQQSLTALGMLLLTVVLFVLVDCTLLPQDRVGVLLVGFGVRDVECSEGAPHGVAVGAAVLQLTQQRLEMPVILKDQLDHVTGDGSATIECCRCHGRHATPLRRASIGLATRPRRPRTARQRRFQHWVRCSAKARLQPPHL
jgi:hypothetical protein